MKKLLLILCCTFSAGVYAANDCELKSKTPSEVATCFQKQSLNEVNQKYNQLLSKTKKEMPSDKFAVTSLVNSQKSWLKYRDSYCETYSTYHQELNNHANCIVDLNNKRALQLQNDIDSF